MVLGNYKMYTFFFCVKYSHNSFIIFSLHNCLYLCIFCYVAIFLHNILFRFLKYIVYCKQNLKSHNFWIFKSSISSWPWPRLARPLAQLYQIYFSTSSSYLDDLFSFRDHQHIVFHLIRWRKKMHLHCNMYVGKFFWGDL